MSTFALMAGGTGGHLFPAEALAEELKRRGHTVHLVTDRRAVNLGEVFPPRCVQVLRTAATPVFSRPLQVVGASFTILGGVAAAIGVLRRIRPDAVVGFGGYPTFPPFLAARILGIPGLLHEQNAVMGRANRALARLARALALSVEPTRHAEAFRGLVEVTGNPVRDRVLALAATPFPPFGDGGRLRLLVFGGSQGARFFSDVVPGAVTALPAELRARISVTQQCREEDLDRVTRAYAAHRTEVELASFFADLPERIAGSHLVIGRAGASTIAELSVIGRPSILVPLPGSLDQDQAANARILEVAGAARVLEQANISPQSLASELQGLLAEPQIMAAMAGRATGVGRPDAVDRLAGLAERVAAGARGETR